MQTNPEMESRIRLKPKPTTNNSRKRKMQLRLWMGNGLVRGVFELIGQLGNPLQAKTKVSIPRTHARETNELHFILVCKQQKHQKKKKATKTPILKKKTSCVKKRAKSDDFACFVNCYLWLFLFLLFCVLFGLIFDIFWWRIEQLNLLLIRFVLCCSCCLSTWANGHYHCVHWNGGKNQCYKLTNNVTRQGAPNY